MFEAIRRAHRGGMLRKYEGGIAAILGATLLTAALNALEPLILKYLVDGLPHGPMRRLINAVLLVAIINVLRAALSARASYRTWRTRLALHQELLDVTVGRLHQLPLSFYKSESVGAIMTRLDRGIQGVIEAASQLAFNALPAVVYLAITIVVMLRLDWRLGLLILILAPLPPLIAVRAAPRQTARERDLLTRWMRIYSRFNEVLAGIMTVKSFSREHEEKQRFITQVAAANRVVISGVGYDAVVGATQNAVVIVAHIAALLVGGVLALRGQITVGSLVAFLGYVGSIFGPVQGLAGVYHTIQTGSVALESIESIIDMPNPVADAPGATDLPPVKGEVTFDHIHF